jgi:hypothetical protein
MESQPLLPRITQIIEEIRAENESQRRAEMLKRHDIYRGKSRRFLVDRIRREFNEDAVREMRIVAINFFKMIVDQKSIVYKKSPIRNAGENKKDQELMDYYVEKLSLDEACQKANLYFNMFSNAAYYLAIQNSAICLKVVPAYSYSIVANPVDQTVADGVVFSYFDRSNNYASGSVTAPTGHSSVAGMIGLTDTGAVASNEKAKAPDDENARFIVWSKTEHATTNGKGAVVFDEDNPDLTNPFEEIPVVLVSKDRDNEAWSEVGSDTADLCLELAMGWTDALTILKHQGYAQSTYTGPEAPSATVMGLNRVLFTQRTTQDEVEGKWGYLTPPSMIPHHLDLLDKLVEAILISQDIDPSAVGIKGGQSATSGFQVLLQMSSVLKSAEKDKAPLRNAELELWKKLARVHNTLFDMGTLDDDAKALGKFSDEFAPSVLLQDMRPIESEKEVIEVLKGKKELGLYSRKQGLKALEPGLSDEQIDARLKEIDEESAARAAAFTAPEGEDKMSGEDKVSDEEETPSPFEKKESDEQAAVPS